MYLKSSVLWQSFFYAKNLALHSYTNTTNAYICISIKTNHSKMNILITGSNGQLGNEMQIVAKSNKSLHFFFTDVSELDITQEKQVLDFCQSNKINIIVNCAAYTAVDKAEDEIELAHKINADAAGILGKAAQAVGAKVIHISTDYVFDGTACEPYNVDHPTAPKSVYGLSKLKGEEALMKYCPEAIIIRTSWLYSSFGNNFVKTITKLGKERDSLSVIFDQIGTPTYAGDLAQAILNIIEQNGTTPGIFHYSNEGACSWYDFAHSILKLQNITCNITPVESTEFPSKVERPKYSVLNKRHIKTAYNITIPHWEVSLQKCLKLIS